MSNFQGLYDVRDFKPEDTNFILATFLRGAYYGNSWYNAIPKDIFMENYKPVANSLVNGGRTIIKVACLPDDPDTILGYSILSPDYQTIVWTFVKKAWREKGIAKSLLPKYPTTVMHLTDIGKILLHKFPNCIFNPFKTL
jgi:hypothetical protein